MWVLWLAAPASALGIGSTGAIGTGSGGLDFGGFDLADGFTVGGFAPTLDFHTSPVLVQVHVIETLNTLIQSEEVYLGANVLFPAHEASLGGSWLGVVEPGFGVDLYADPLVFGLTGQCRLGAQVQEAAGFGVYVVPELGLLLGDTDTEWVGGGTLQVSVWFGG